MGIMRIFVVWCLFCFCYCQQREDDTAISDASKSDIIIRRPTTTNDSNITINDNNNSSDSAATPTNLSSSKEKEDIFSACEINPCKNGGDCLEDFFDSSVYRCMCPAGYTGARCGVKDNCVVDGSIVCKKGYCAYSKDRSVKGCKCFVGMFWDDNKEECKYPDPPCFPNPCLNGGVCTVDHDKAFKCECSDGYEGPTCSIENKCLVGDHCPGGRCEERKEDYIKFCSCFEGKYWNEILKRCEDVDPPCVPNPCENGGKCEALSNGEYHCHCSGHYLDENCREEDLCYNKNDNNTMCGGNGACVITNGNSSKCDCYEGYYFDAEMRTCRETFPPCFPNPCANDGLCTPVEDHFNCTCSEGYAGELCKDLDFCILQGGHTLCGEASCESINDLETFRCRCGEGYFFDYNKRICLEIDFCSIITCGTNEQCINSECVCQDHFVRNNSTQKCEANFCAANPCPADDMICTEGKGIIDYSCSCREGYSFNGNQCEEAVCVFPKLNGCEQVCVPSEEGFRCKCDSEHFVLDENNKTCIYIGNATCSNKTCEMGKCVKDENGEEFCVCLNGYVEEEGKCVDICMSKRVPNGICPDNLCESTNDGFRCKCEGKYKFSDDKVTCTNRRMCEKGEPGWTACKAKGATCIEDWNSDLGYSCLCSFPHKESDQGICQDVCDSEEYQRNCSDQGARCDIDSNGEQTCKCPPLYKQAKNGEYCNQLADVSYLLTIPLDLDSYKIGQGRRTKISRSLDTEYSADYFQIQNDAEKALSKIFPELIQMNIIDCKTNVNYFLCKIELQFTSITDEDLKRTKIPDFCLLRNDSSDKCLVPPSLISRSSQLKKHLSIVESDPCDADVNERLCGSETVCTSSKKSFNCTCDTGYEMRDKVFPFVGSSSFIEVCKDINECLIDGVCPQHTICENLIGSYSCSCMPGYRIKDKSTDPKVDGCVEICNPNPCDHGNCEKIDSSDFVCRCEAGFTGVLCDLTDSNFKRAQTNTIIVGAVLGGVLLITLIIFFVTVQRLKKKKDEEPDQMVYGAEMSERRGGAVNNAYQ